MPEEQNEGRTINLMDYLALLLRWKRYIVINLVVLTVLTAGITLLIPNRFKSTASLLPPKQRSGASLQGSISQIARDFLPLGNLGRLGTPQEAYNYLAVLGSYTAMEKLIKKFDLAEVYNIKPRTSIEKTIKAVKDYLDFTIEEEGTITITVWDEDPRRAADMANYLVEVLNEISLRLGTQEARDNRQFIEKRYLKVIEDLRIAEDSLKMFQRKYGIYSIQEALSGKFLSSFVPLEQVPDLTMQYIRLYRDLEIQNKLLEFSLPMYEQAKVDEQKDIPVVLILDEAVPGERKDTPKRMLIVLASAVLFGILLVLTIFFMEAIEVRNERLHPLEGRLNTFTGKIRRLYKVRE